MADLFTYCGEYEMDAAGYRDITLYTTTNDVVERVDDRRLRVVHREAADSLKELKKKVNAYNRDHDCYGPYFSTGTVKDKTTGNVWEVDMFCLKKR